MQITRFIYIADTHFGTERMAYQQQKGYPAKLENILSRLDEWIIKDGKIDFILHGGDMINRTEEEIIRKALKLFRLSVPVYLCLGNHDLTEQNAVEIWMRKAPEFFPGKRPDYSLQYGSSIIHVIPNHWEETPYYWNSKQEPYFLDDQITRIDKALKKYPEYFHILSTHSPVFGIPAEQTGFEELYHTPPASFTKAVMDFTAQHRQIRCVLSAHNHINMHIEKNTVNFVTVSSLVEPPFEFKLIELGKKVIKMSTISLIPHVDFKAEYDYSKTYVQGRKRDREFENHSHLIISP